MNLLEYAILGKASKHFVLNEGPKFFVADVMFIMLLLDVNIIA